jgi:hypothetical protein
MMVALIAAALIAAADTTPEATPTPTAAAPTPIEVPSPAETASPSDSIVLDGTVVSAAHMMGLFNAFQLSRTSPRIVINVIEKPTAAMPNGALWHYAGSKPAATRVNSWVWIDKSAPHTSDADQRMLASGIAAGIMLAIMDSGFAGAFWKQFYDEEAAKDKSDAARGGDPFGHRDAVAQRIGNAMVGH